MATISRPLTALTRKDVTFDWTEECKVAFCEVKQRLMLVPTRSYQAIPIMDREGLVQWLSRRIKKVAGTQLHMPAELRMR